MGVRTKIEWRDHTFNPWWGCAPVSPGCLHCYAEVWAKRYGDDQLWGRTAWCRVFGEVHWREPRRWNRAAEREGRRARVFCASMADVFDDYPHVVGERQKLWSLVRTTPHLDWLLLTKRPERIMEHVPPEWHRAWPTNVWALTSVETHAIAERRIPQLLEVPAPVWGLSVEPLLEAIDLMPWLSSLQWVIVGGESGRGARPMHPDWVRSLRDQCRSAGVAFFFKQWHQESTPKPGRVLDGRAWEEFPTP